MLWTEAFHAYEFARNIMATTCSTKALFGIFYEEKQNIIGLFSDFVCIGYVNTMEKNRKQKTENM